MAVTYHKNSTLENLKKQALQKVAEHRKLIFDPKNPKTNGLKGSAYAALYTAGLGALTYLSEPENREFTKDYWMKAFGLRENDKAIVPRPSPLPDKVAGVNAPNANKMLNGLIEAQNKTTEGYNSVVESLNTLIENERVQRLQESQDIVNQTQGQSPFLNNQIYLKNALDDLILSSKEQTGALVSICGILDLHLGALAQLSGIAVNTQLKEADAKIYETVSMDYGDSNFFYSFIPTSEYWAKADLAQYEYDRINNVTTQLFTLPSRLYASGEISIIDQLEGVESNSFIRGKVEEYRKSRLSSGIRALIGQTAIDASRDQAETNSKAKEYYTTATEALKENAVPEALNSLVSAVAPIAEWADSAKVREDFLTTPRVVVKDLNGVVVKENATPLEITLAKDVALAKGEADENSIGTDTIDFLTDLFDDMDISSDFFKRYVRIDEMLQHAKTHPDVNTGDWEAIMQGLFS